MRQGLLRVKSIDSGSLAFGVRVEKLYFKIRVRQGVFVLSIKVLMSLLRLIQYY